MRHIVSIPLATRTTPSPFEGPLLYSGGGKSLQLSHMIAVEIISVRHLHFRATQHSNEVPSILRPILSNAVSLLFDFLQPPSVCFQQAPHGIVFHAFTYCYCLIALERTFLGYLRTSLALSIVAVIIAQLFKLEHNVKPNKTFGFYALSIPLSCACIGSAMVVLILGAYRFWRQQNAILRGKVHAGGWEVNAIGVTVLMVCGRQLPTL